LEKLDYVIAGVHSQMKMTREQMTERVIRAIKNPHIDILAHPTGRILKRRDEFQVDFDKILKVAKETGTILEIDAYPDRLDLNDINIKRAKEAGVKMIINTDAHQKSQLSLMEYGVSQARRGWAEKRDIINTWAVEKFLRAMK
jgi:DNA polymerase (family 10)